MKNGLKKLHPGTLRGNTWQIDTGFCLPSFNPRWQLPCKMLVLAGLKEIFSKRRCLGCFSRKNEVTVHAWEVRNRHFHSVDSFKLTMAMFAQFLGVRGLFRDACPSFLPLPTSPPPNHLLLSPSSPPPHPHASKPRDPNRRQENTKPRQKTITLDRKPLPRLKTFQ